MYFYLKNLTATQQIGALFLIVFGLLLLASVVALCCRCANTAKTPRVTCAAKS